MTSKNNKNNNNNNNKDKNYEKVNIVSSDGDSVYPIPIEESRGGQIFYSFDVIRDIVKEELDKRFGPALNNNEEDV